MQIDFSTSLKTVSDPQIVGMTTYPLEELLLAILTGVLCRACELACKSDPLRWVIGV